MGYPMAGHLAARGPSRHRLQPHRQEGRPVGRGVRRPRGAHAARGGRRGADRLFVRRQRRRPAQRDARRRRRVCRHGQGRDRVRRHDRLGPRGARAVCRGPRPRPALHRRPGVGRPGRRGQRRADRDVRRRPGAVRARAAGGDGVREGGDPHRRNRRRTARRRWSTSSASPVWSRACPRASTSARPPAST